VPEGSHEASSILRIHKYWMPKKLVPKHTWRTGICAQQFTPNIYVENGFQCIITVYKIFSYWDNLFVRLQQMNKGWRNGPYCWRTVYVIHVRAVRAVVQVVSTNNLLVWFQSYIKILNT